MAQASYQHLAKLRTLFQLSIFLFALNSFFVSIKLMGAFKSLGKGIGEDVFTQFYHNPAMGLALGILITVIMQSSSTTTSIVVALAATGTFGKNPTDALQMAIPIIMGANIGTCVTNTLVSFAHIGSKKEFSQAFASATVHDFFNLLAVVIFLPIQLYTNFLGKASIGLANMFTGVEGSTYESPLKLLLNPQVSQIKSWFGNEWVINAFVILLFSFLAIIWLRYFVSQVQKNSTVAPSIFSTVLIASFVFIFQHFSTTLFSKEVAIFLLSLTILYVSLMLIVMSMRSMVLKKVEILFHKYIFKTDGRALVFGILITALVQSSSVSTSLIIPLAGAGILTVYQVFPYSLGANVGTTITAMLAALSTGHPISIAIAFSHLLFNLLGIAVIYPIKKIPISLSLALARLSEKSRILPIVAVAMIFIGTPLILIMVFK